MTMTTGTAGRLETIRLWVAPFTARPIALLGVAILLVEQNFNVARQVGDSVAVMDDGRIVHSGAMAALAADEDLQQRLLGLSLAAHG